MKKIIAILVPCVLALALGIGAIFYFVLKFFPVCWSVYIFSKQMLLFLQKVSISVMPLSKCWSVVEVL